jgi:TIR domain-containing protein
LRGYDVFICYSHKDAQHWDRLKTHLAFYEKNGTLNVWEESRLAPGSLWRVEMEAAISKTKIAILLVSADFLASSLIMEDHVPRLLAAAKTKEVIIIPVIVGACAFQETVLAQFQPANDPSKPLKSMRPSGREKIWYELAMAVHTELSKASRNDLIGELIIYANELRELVLNLSAPLDLFEAFDNNSSLDYAIIDLGLGQRWLTSRLYLFALILERMRGLRCFVFLETGGKTEQRFLGMASPAEVKWRLACHYPWLETAFAKVYSDMSDHIRILSATGALHDGTAQEIVYCFLSHPNIQQRLAPGMPPHPGDSEWEALSMEYGQQLWEHARWLDATRLGQDLGDVLQQDESTWLKESPHISHLEQVRFILQSNAPFVALVDEEKRFRSLIDRQALLERTVADQYLK